MDTDGYADEIDFREVIKLAGGIVGEEGGENPKILELVKELESLWRWEDYLDFDMKDGEWALQISTGGWSSHENIIDKLMNTWFWFLYWQMSKRGGHYWFAGKLI